MARAAGPTDHTGLGESILQIKAPTDGFKPRSDMAVFRFQIDVINGEIKDVLKLEPKKADDKTMENS